MELSSLGLCSQLKPSLTVQPYRQGHVNTLTYDSSYSFLLTWVIQDVGSFFPGVTAPAAGGIWVTGQYWFENRVVQLSQDQAGDITAVGFRSHSPPFLYS